jgi:hypothetical protein
MICREDDGAVIDHAFAMQPTQPEKDPADEFDEVVANPVIRIQIN